LGRVDGILLGQWLYKGEDVYGIKTIWRFALELEEGMKAYGFQGQCDMYLNPLLTFISRDLALRNSQREKHVKGDSKTCLCLLNQI
jgi:hypothetical protein